MIHYDPEREKELRRLFLEEQIAKDRRRKLNKKGEAVFLISFAFIVISIIILWGE